MQQATTIAALAAAQGWTRYKVQNSDGLDVQGVPPLDPVPPRYYADRFVVRSGGQRLEVVRWDGGRSA